MDIKLFNQGQASIQYDTGKELKPKQTESFSQKQGRKLLRLFPKDLLDVGSSDNRSNKEDVDKLAKDRAAFDEEIAAARKTFEMDRKSLEDSRADLEAEREELNAERDALEKDKKAFEAERDEFLESLDETQADLEIEGAEETGEETVPKKPSNSKKAKK